MASSRSFAQLNVHFYSRKAGDMFAVFNGSAVETTHLLEK